MTKHYSMTGFARWEGQVGGGRLVVEAKAVNHRYLDLKLHLPRELMAWEEKITELARGFFQRGRLELWAELSVSERPVQVTWNRPLAQALLATLQEMKSELNLSGEPDLSLLAREKDVIVVPALSSLSEESWVEAREIFLGCFQELQAMRAREGETLAKDILSRLSEIKKRVEKIKALAENLLPPLRERLEKRIKDLMPGGGALDQTRLAQELAIWADRLDITEEIVRLESHLAQFQEVMAEDAAKGRKLDFLVQEMFREINTAVNKAQEVNISRLAVEIKTELEKIREQVQNLE